MDGKEIHRRVMIGMGMFTLATGFAAAYLAFGGPGELPMFMYGRLSKPKPSPVPITRRPRASLVAWRQWSKELLNEAKKRDRLILLDMHRLGCRSCRVMDETTYADPAAAQFISKNFIPVRVDADQRPDLVLRYFFGRPTTALLLPSGEILAGGAFIAPPLFLNWAQTIEAAFRKNRVKVMQALHPLAQARRETTQNREDPVWGGVFHLQEYDKRLADQAEAFTRLASSEPESARRVLDYVSLFLSDPQGGYFAGQAGELMRDNTIIEGKYFFALPNKKRWALGFPPVDTRIFAGPNGRMAAAVLRSEEIGEPGRAQALKTLDRFWVEGVKDGKVRHQLGGDVTVFLEDQIALAQAYLAAYSATGLRRDLDRATDIIAATEAQLWDKKSSSFYDRPALGELPEGLDRLIVSDLNKEALLLKGADQ